MRTLDSRVLVLEQRAKLLGHSVDHRAIRSLVRVQGGSFAESASLQESVIVAPLDETAEVHPSAVQRTSKRPLVLRGCAELPNRPLQSHHEGTALLRVLQKDRL